MRILAHKYGPTDLLAKIICLEAYVSESEMHIG